MVLVDFSHAPRGTFTLKAAHTFIFLDGIVKPPPIRLLTLKRTRLIHERVKLGDGIDTGEFHDALKGITAVLVGNKVKREKGKVFATDADTAG